MSKQRSTKNSKREERLGITVLIVLFIILIILFSYVYKVSYDKYNKYEFSKNGELHKSHNCWLNENDIGVCEYRNCVIEVDYYYEV